MMKINYFCKIITLFGLGLIFSCGQDSIFFTISTETKPVPPRIPGSPTNMVEFERKYEDAKSDINPEGKVSIMYAASGDLHWYAKTRRGDGAPGWDSPEYRIPQPVGNGKVIGLAATKDHLYALCIIGSGVSTVLRRIGSGEGENEWKDIENSDKIKYTLIQSIFADKDTGRLFAGSMNNSGSDYGILYLDASDPNAPTLRLIVSDTEILSGAASRDGFHYLSTRGKGVYKAAADVSSVVPLKELVRKKDEAGNEYMDEAEGNRLFMGMIQLEDGAILAIERSGGALFEVRESGFRLLKYIVTENGVPKEGESVATGRYATGALALWQEVLYDDNGDPQPGVKKMLIAGIQGGLYSTTTTSSYTHGYVEFELNDDGSLNVNLSKPNISPSITVHNNNARYTATIGKHPINHLYQARPEIDANMTFFASTQTAGLWSYRDRDGGLQWNAEN